MNDTSEAARVDQPERMEPEKKLDSSFKIPKKLNSKRKCNTRLSNSKRLKIRVPKRVEKTPAQNPDVPNELQSSVESPVVEKQCVLKKFEKQCDVKECKNKSDSDDDCLSISCSSLFSEDFIEKSNITQKSFQIEKRNISHLTLEKELKSNKESTEPILPSLEFQDENRNLLDSGFEEGSPSFTEVRVTRSLQRQNISSREIRTSLDRDNNFDSKVSPIYRPIKIVSGSVAKSLNAVSSANADVGLKRANLESRIGSIWNSRITNLKNLLDTCKKWKCEVRNLHEVPDNSEDMDEKRAEELRNSFIDHLPLLVDLIFGRKVQVSGRSLNILIEQLLEAIEVSLKTDMCHAISQLLYTACTIFSHHYKIIHNILGGCIKHNKTLKNVLEGVRPLLSMPNFHWPLWLQERIISDLIQNQITISEQDYSALFQVLSSHLFDQLPRPQRTLNLVSKLQALENEHELTNQSAFISLRSIQSQPSVGLSTYEKSKPSEFFSLKSMHSQPTVPYLMESPRNCSIPVQSSSDFPLPISPSISSPSTFSQTNNVPINLNANNDANNSLRFSSNIITDLVLSDQAHSAIDILKKFDVEELFKVAHNLFIHRSSEYANVVLALMSYLKNRSFLHLLNRNLNTFMSTLSFNLLVKFIQDDSVEKALSFFNEIKQAGFEYLHAQLFPESLGEVDCPSQMKTVLIAVDLCINSDEYDQAAQIFIDNDLLGDRSKWKLNVTSESDIELRDRYINHIFSLLLEDSRVHLTMLACKLFTEMQKQCSSFTSNSAQMARLITKLLSRSAWNKMAFDIFMNFYSKADIASKCTFAVNESTICRAMLVVSNSIDPYKTSTLLQEFLEWDVYPIWKLEDNVIIVHSNWVKIEIEILLKNHIQRLVNRLKLPTFGFVRPKELSIMVEEFTSEEGIAILQKEDSSFNTSVDELREMLFSFHPPIRSVSHKRKLITVHEDWKLYLNSRISNLKDNKQTSIE